jgi:hypothetical protein
MSNSVLALTEWDGKLIAGGYFTEAGGIPAAYVAAWDGQAWASLGSGMNDRVRGLTVFQGKLVACGSFTIAGGNPANRIAMWDGASWAPLGSGLDNRADAVGVYGDHLYVGGFFLNAGGQTVNRIAKWDGSSWSPLGSGIDGCSNQIGSVLAVRILGVHAGSLFVGGRFNNAGQKPAYYLARWTDPSVGVPEAPEVRLGGVYPNPFNQRVNFSYELPLPGSYRLVVYDVQGRRIKNLAQGFMGAGSYQQYWDGTNERGVQTSPGVYFMELTGPRDSVTHKVVFRP